MSSLLVFLVMIDSAGSKRITNGETDGVLSTLNVKFAKSVAVFAVNPKALVFVQEISTTTFPPERLEFCIGQVQSPDDIRVELASIDETLTSGVVPEKG